MLTSSMFLSGLTYKTLSLPLALFNLAPKRSGLVKHPDVPIYSLGTESVTGPRLVKRGLRSKPQAYPVLRGGFLTSKVA